MNTKTAKPSTMDATITTDLQQSERIINEQLQKIFAYSQFSTSDILKRFLSFVVNEVLAGRSQTIKEYTIGTQVLNKPMDFKPQQDAIVRIHAGRLRRALMNYYNETGMNDVVRIMIPKGSYIPLFVHINDKIKNNASSVNSDAKKADLYISNKITIIPFQHFETNPSRIAFVDSLGQQLSTACTQLRNMSVTSYYATRQLSSKMPINEIALKYKSRYVITGNVQFESMELRIGIQLTDANTEELIWAESYDRRYNGITFFKIQDDIVECMMLVLDRFYGVAEPQTPSIFTHTTINNQAFAKA
jgi:TolB-like protein